MPACAMRPDDKKAMIGAVGQDLVRRHGKRDYYPAKQVRQSAQSVGYPIDVTCWAMCIFTSPTEFASVHASAGEVCDYAAMKAEVLADLAGGAAFSLFDIDLSWLQWPDIDLSALFDWF